MSGYPGRLSIPLIVIASVLSLGLSAWADQPHRIRYSLRTDMSGGGMAFIGAGPGVEGVKNPVLQAEVGDTLEIVLINADGVEHDVVVPDFNASSDVVGDKGMSVTLSFTADKAGTFAYFCDIPGHREAGMEGKLVVEDEKAEMPGMGAAPAAGQAVDIVRAPVDLPPPLPRRAPARVRIDLEAREVVGTLAPGATFTYWTFNGTVPGPFYRVRIGDTVEVRFKNAASSRMAHSVDFHAVTGPGGGAVMTATPPGGETMFTFKALRAGLYVYHCATPMVAEHIANGMYGMILVEPAEGLRKVDRELYVMQGEIYTKARYGATGQQEPDIAKLLDERPDYFVFNGAVGALTEQKPLKARVGETIRIFFGDGGPNALSSFHLIGAIFDRLYSLGTVTSAPLTDVQTALVPPGGSAVAEVSLVVPGKFILVDHALSRMQRGLSGWLIVEGAPRPDLYNGVMQPGSGH
jgi:nitrite reductase (NO-forming)